MKEDELLHGGGQTQEVEKPLATPTRKSRKPFLFIGTVIIFVVLALALGLGLGLGLKHKKASVGGGHSSNGTSPNLTNGTGESPDISENIPSWRRNPLEYNLDMSWDINAAPTTRVFNLTVSEIQAAPDGIMIQCNSASTYLLTYERDSSTIAGYKRTVSWPPHTSKSRRSSLN
jgi:hypothetical protein